MTDWREMEAGRELDWLIAQRLGYRYENDTLTRPDGTTYKNILTEMRGAIAFLIPHYSTSVDAALTLIEKQDLGVSDVWLRGFVGGTWVSQLPCLPVEGQVVTGYGDTPALAICRAWLAYKERAND